MIDCPQPTAALTRCAGSSLPALAKRGVVHRGELMRPAALLAAAGRLFAQPTIDPVSVDLGGRVTGGRSDDHTSLSSAISLLLCAYGLVWLPYCRFDDAVQREQNGDATSRAKY